MSSLANPFQVKFCTPGARRLSTGLLLAVFALNCHQSLQIAAAHGNVNFARQPTAPGSGQPFADCLAPETCPLLVAVPASITPVMIGSPLDEPGRITNEPLRQVVFSKSFAIGRTEVTVGEYLTCVAARKCRAPEWLEPGGEFNVETGTNSHYRRLSVEVLGDNRPVVGVSHSDAVDFTGWLSSKTGYAYRLPSEAEWEYATRAGTTTAYWWGDTPKSGGKVMSNCRDCGSDFDGRAAAPAISFAPNRWGLYNVHGNVWEWVADFYCDDPRSSPVDGSARQADNCQHRDALGLRVMRGGSSFYEANKMRAASRLRNHPHFRAISVGFRIARDIE